MNNIEQYINYNNCNSLYNNVDNNSTIINSNSNLNPILKEDSQYLLVKNFLSEYNKDFEKELVMLNILLLDKVPTEGSTKLVNSGVIYKIIRENKDLYDTIISLINNLEKKKLDKSNTSSGLSQVATTGDYYDLINTPTKISNFFNDLKYITELDLFNNVYSKQEINNKIETLENSQDILLLLSQQLERIEALELGGLEKIKHIFITQKLYDLLESYEKDTLYFIIESSEETSHFGDAFPLTLG